MNRDEYFYVFEAIIISLALTEILIGLNKMIIARKTIKVYWAHLILVFVYIEILIAQYAWEFYRNPFDLVNSVFTFFIFVVIFPVSYFFGAYQVFPKNSENVDFKIFFHSHRKEILIPVIIMQIAVVNKSLSEIISARGVEYFWQFIASLSSWYIWQQTVFVFLIVYAAFSKKNWPSEVLAILALVAQTSISFVKFAPH